MGTVYSVKFRINTEEDKKRFAFAFSDIHALASLMFHSKNEQVKDFIRDPIGDDDEYWLDVDEDSVSAFAECGFTTIAKHHADKIPRKIEYYFGKVYPAPPEFLAALISIIYHYFPKATLSNDLFDQEEEFSDGMLLAQLINPKIIKNPLETLIESMKTFEKPSKHFSFFYQVLREAYEEKFSFEDESSTGSLKKTTAASSSTTVQEEGDTEKKSKANSKKRPLDASSTSTEQKPENEAPPSKRQKQGDDKQKTKPDYLSSSTYSMFGAATPAKSSVTATTTISTHAHSLSNDDVEMRCDDYSHTEHKSSPS